MSSADRFKSYAPDVRSVVRLEEALPPDHPAHVFIDLVRSVDLGHFAIPPGPKGEKPYHPHALLGLLAWGYLHGARTFPGAGTTADQFAALAGRIAYAEPLAADLRDAAGRPEHGRGGGSRLVACQS